MTQAFNLSQLANNVNTSGQLNAAAGLYNQVSVPNGGTGVATLTANAVIIGNGTSAVTSVAASTLGNVLTSNGTTWVSQAASGGTPILRVYTSPGTWTKPATVKAIKVTVVGGGGNGGQIVAPTNPASGGGMYLNGGSAGGTAISFLPAPTIPGPQPYTVGGIAATSSFGAAPLTVITATGGTSGSSSSNAAPVQLVAGLAGGAASGGNLNIAGGYSNGSDNTAIVSGGGGASLLGLGGRNRMPADTTGAGFAATGYGAGGGGALRIANNGGTQSGGAGTAGIIIIEEFY